LCKEEDIVGIGTKKTGSLEHRLIFLDIKKRQRDTLVQISKFLVCSLLSYHFDQPILSA
jgi:hypothetical protein